MASLNFEIVEVSSGGFYYYALEEKCIYTRDRDRNGTVYIRCIEKNCKSRAKIITGQFMRTNKEIHCHPLHSVKIEYEKAVVKAKNLVLTDQRKVRLIHSEVLKKLSLKAAGLFFWQRVRFTLQRVRRSNMPACQSLSDLINLLEENTFVQENYGTIRETLFYQGAYGEKCIFFANLEIVAELDNNFDLMADGTFNVTPFRIHQLLVVLATIHGKPRPIFYALMTARSFQQYVIVFQFLKEAILSFDGKIRTPKSGITDFEKPMRNAIKKVWEEIELFGCNFHWCQSLRRRANKFKELSDKITGFTIQHQILGMFMRLSLLPLMRVQHGYVMLKEFIEIHSVQDDFSNFIAYFDNTWLKRFKIHEWCVSSCDFRTNNHVEGHNKLIKDFIIRNPSPWKFMEALNELAHEASSSLQDYLIRRNESQDRSNLTIPLKNALIKLEAGKINEIEFLKRLANIH